MDFQHRRLRWRPTNETAGLASPLDESGAARARSAPCSRSCASNHISRSARARTGCDARRPFARDDAPLDVRANAPCSAALRIGRTVFTARHLLDRGDESRGDIVARDMPAALTTRTPPLQTQSTARRPANIQASRIPSSSRPAKAAATPGRATRDRRRRLARCRRRRARAPARRRRPRRRTAPVRSSRRRRASTLRGAWRDAAHIRAGAIPRRRRSRTLESVPMPKRRARRRRPR